MMKPAKEDQLFLVGCSSLGGGGEMVGLEQVTAVAAVNRTPVPVFVQ